MFKNKIILLAVLPCVALADSSSLNLNLPSSPQTYASDRIRAGDLDCQNAIGSSTNLEFGVVGIIDGPGYDPYSVSNNVGMNTEIPQMRGAQVDDVGVYARITIPIGAPKDRINCNDLYKLELEKKRMEVLKLKQEIENLKQLKFQDDEEEN